MPFLLIYDMKRGKKAQIAIFVIVAIILVSTISVLLILNKPKSNSQSQDSQVISFIEDCIKQTGEQAIYYNGLSGGYYLSPKLSTDNKIPYYYYEGKDYSLSEQRYEEELSKFMDSTLPFCTKNFIDFPDFNISQGEVKTKTKITNKSVIFDVIYPLSIKKGDTSYFYKDFSYEVPVKLGIMHYSVNEFMKEQLKEPSLCISCLGEIAEKNNLYVYLLDYKDSLIINFIDNSTKINSNELRLRFAIKYA
jgi:hypothetical protein